MNRRNGNRLQMLLRFGMKPAILALSMVVMITSVASGSLAWLTATTPTITNTFTYGNVWIDLEESDTNKDNDNNPDTNEYPMQPNRPIKKDPKVTVFANSKDSWLFVELVESSNFSTYLEYKIATGWNQLFTVTDRVTGEVRSVYYREVDEMTTDQEFPVLLGDTVYVKDVTQEQLQQLNADNYPTLSITAYAAQKEDTDTMSNYANAWAYIKSDDTDLVKDQYPSTVMDEQIEPTTPEQPGSDELEQPAGEQTQIEGESAPNGNPLSDAQVEPTNPEQPGSDEPQQPAGGQIQTEGEPQQPAPEQPGTDESEQPNGNPPAGAPVDPSINEGPGAE